MPHIETVYIHDRKFGKDSHETKSDDNCSDQCMSSRV